MCVDCCGCVGRLDESIGFQGVSGYFVICILWGGVLVDVGWWCVWCVCRFCLVYFVNDVIFIINFDFG